MSASQPDIRAFADELLSAWEAEQMRGGYRFLPARFVSRVAAYEQANGAIARAEMLRDMLLHLLDRLDEIRRRPLRPLLPPSIEEWLAVQHDRMRREYRDCAEESLLRLNTDLYLKDLGVAALKLVPTGASVLDINRGVPRSVLLHALRRSVQHGFSLAGVLLRQGGFRPALESHMSLKARSEFTLERRRLGFRRIADLLRANPQYVCMFGSSWYYDPALLAISPHLLHWREEPERHGAQFTPVATDEAVIRNALSTSNTRRTLYEQGKYQPRAYMMIWSSQLLSAYGEQACERTAPPAG